MVCFECGLLLEGGEDYCPRCNARARCKRIDISLDLSSKTIQSFDAASRRTQSSMPVSSPRMPREAGDRPYRPDSVMASGERIRPVYGILFFVIIGIPSLISLVWMLTHNNG